MAKPAAVDLESALCAVPLFPLHQAVLFPNALLALHVFEPRYTALIADVLASHRTLCIAHVPDPEADMAGLPAIAELAGVGTIVEHAELPGGRFQVMLLGRARIRLQELRYSPPYRRALGRVVESTSLAVPPPELAAMHGTAAAFANQLRRGDPSLRIQLPRNTNTEALVDNLAHHLILSPRARQEALQELDLRKRVRHVTEVLTAQRSVLACHSAELPN